MDWLINIPIRRKLMLITAIASATALLLAGSIIVTYDTIAYRTKQKQDISVRAEIVAENVSASIVFNDPKTAQGYLQAMSASPEITVAGIYVMDGTIFSSYVRPGIQAPPLPTQVGPQGLHFKGNDLVVFWPIKEGIERVGTLYFRAHFEPLARRLARYGAIILLVMIVSLLITVPISMRLNAVIVNPIREMTEAARLIAAGEIFVKPVTQPRNDELGYLEEKFRQMAESLQEKAAIGRQIAAGDLDLKILPQSDKDVLGNAFVAMVKSLQEKAEVATKIATGDLTVPITLQSERDVLGRAFTSMTENLRAMNSELSEGIDVLATSTNAIMAGTSQIAAGATETATVVSQTVTTVEEMKQTVMVSSQKAKYVSETAQKTVQVSQSGRKSVEDVVQGMSHIQLQMESIADSIIRLSEQNQAIGEIIATVRDLAEQSNLLAVNAAIEANKAGELGRGFTVVAQEVKSLSEQSKKATSQIRLILSEIQKGTDLAVLATEQGSKAVAAGVKQSKEAGEAIRLLAESIGENASAASQIAVSAQQQMVGMDQLAMATLSIKETTTLNMESTKHAELAAYDLHTLGLKLKQLVERYRI